MHIHEIAFEVVNREGLVLNDDGEVVEPIRLNGEITPPQPWETGFKDTVFAYPRQVTRGSRDDSRPPVSSCGTATSSSTRTTR